MGIGSMCLSLADTLLSHKISSLKQEEATQIISSLTVLLCNAHRLQPGDIELVLAVTSKLAAQLSANSVQAQVGASHDQRMPVAKTDINGQAYAPKLPMGFGSLVTPSQRPSASPMVSTPAGQLSQQQSSNTHAVFNSAAGKVPVSPYHAKAVVRQLTAKLAAGGQPPLLRLVPLLAALATGKHESMLQWLRRSSGSLAAPLQQGFSAAQLPAGNSSNTKSRGASAVPEYSGIAASRQGISVPGGQAGSCTQVQSAWQGVEAAMVQAEQQALRAMQALMGTAADAAAAASGAAGSCLQALALCAGDARCVDDATSNKKKLETS